MKAIAWLLLALGLFTLPARADTALALYTQGKYAAAIQAGIRDNNAPGFALAARAELAEEMLRETPCLACLKRAEADARRAIEADPKTVEGHVDAALALGYQARIIGKLAAHFKRYAEQAKDHLDAALAVDPQNPWASAALGGWNIEIVRGGGRTLARWLYGASIENGLADFSKAFAAAPGSAVLRYQYALSLSGYDRDTYRSAIEDALERCVAAKPDSAFETVAQTRARDLLHALEAANWPEFDRLVRKDQRYP
jgi:hypothetical protein